MSQRGPFDAPSSWPPCPPSGRAGESDEGEHGGAEGEVAEVVQGLIEAAIAGASTPGACMQGPGTDRDGHGEAAQDSRGVEEAELSVDFSGLGLRAHMADHEADAPFEGRLADDRDRAQAQAGVRELLLGILRADFGRRLRWTQGRERAVLGGLAGGAAAAAAERLRDGLTRARACATRKAVFSRNFVTPTRLSQGRAGRARPVSACSIAGNQSLQAAVRDAVRHARASPFRREEHAGTEAQEAEGRREEVAPERRAEAAACNDTPRRPLSARSNSASPGWLSSVVGLLFVAPCCAICGDDHLPLFSCVIAPLCVISAGVDRLRGWRVTQALAPTWCTASSCPPATRHQTHHATPAYANVSTYSYM